MRGNIQPPPSFLSPELKQQIMSRQSSCQHKWEEAYSMWSSQNQGTVCFKCGASRVPS